MTSTATTEVVTIEYVGVAGVAAWFGVGPATVTTWITRYATAGRYGAANPTPRPDAVIRPGRTEDGDKGWLPAREAEWRAWEASRTGQGAPGMPKPRRNDGRCTYDATCGEHPGDPSHGMAQVQP